MNSRTHSKSLGTVFWHQPNGNRASQRTQSVGTHSASQDETRLVSHPRPRQWSDCTRTLPSSSGHQSSQCLACPCAHFPGAGLLSGGKNTIEQMSGTCVYFCLLSVPRILPCTALSQLDISHQILLPRRAATSSLAANILFSMAPSNSSLPPIPLSGFKIGGPTSLFLIR